MEAFTAPLSHHTLALNHVALFSNVNKWCLALHDTVFLHIHKFFRLFFPEISGVSKEFVTVLAPILLGTYYTIRLLSSGTSWSGVCEPGLIHQLLNLTSPVHSSEDLIAFRQNHEVIMGEQVLI